MHSATKACLGDQISRIDVEIEELLPQRKISGGNRTFCMALSRDDARVFTGREDGWLFSWPLKHGSSIKKVHVDTSIERMLVTDDGKLVVLTGDGSIAVLDETDLHTIASRPGAHARGIFAVAFDPRGRLLTTGGLDGWIKTWQFPSLVPIASSKSPKHGILSLAIVQCNGGSLIFAGNVNGNITVFDLATLASAGSFKGHDGPIFSIKNPPGGSNNRISCLSAGSDGVVLAWKAGSTKPLFEIRSGQTKLLDVLPMPRQDGGMAVYTAGGDGSIGAWSLVPGDPSCAQVEQLGCFQVHERTVEQIVASANGKQVLSVASDGSMQRLRI